MQYDIKQSIAYLFEGHCSSTELPHYTETTGIAGCLDIVKDYQNKIQKIHNEIGKNIYISDVIIWMRREGYDIDDIICVIGKLDKGDELKAVDEWSISSIGYVYSLIK